MSLFITTLAIKPPFVCGLELAEKGVFRLTDEGGIRTTDDNIKRGPDNV